MYPWLPITCKTRTSDIKLVGRHRKEGGDDILGEGLVNLPGNFFYKGLWYKGPNLGHHLWVVSAGWIQAKKDRHAQRTMFHKVPHPHSTRLLIFTEIPRRHRTRERRCVRWQNLIPSASYALPLQAGQRLETSERSPAKCGGEAALPDCQHMGLGVLRRLLWLWIRAEWFLLQTLWIILTMTLHAVALVSLLPGSCFQPQMTSNKH